MRRRDGLLIAVIAAIAAAMVGAAVLLVVGTPTDPGSVLPGGRPPPMVAIKIDNAPAARPQTGLGAAEIVYVLPVEGGLTRLLALYGDDLPDVAGPVRSARRLDADVLAQYGVPTFAYAGAAKRLLPRIQQGSVVDGSPRTVPDAYFREQDRKAPHNLYVRPHGLPEPAEAPPGPAFARGEGPPGGKPVDRHEVAYPATTYTFTWSEDDRRWRVAMDGEPATDAGEPVTVAGVIEQVVAMMRTDPEVGRPIPQALGTGAVTALRDGERFSGSWSDRSPEAPLQLYTDEGNQLLLPDGPLWVLIVPTTG